MAGHVGKRAKPAGLCTICGVQIVGEFMRHRRGDTHIMNVDGSYPCQRVRSMQEFEAETSAWSPLDWSLYANSEFEDDMERDRR